MSVTRLDTVNVTKPCRACGANVVTSHDRIPVCAGCRSRGLAWQQEAEAARKQIRGKIRKMHTPRLEDGEKVGCVFVEITRIPHLSAAICRSAQTT